MRHNIELCQCEPPKTLNAAIQANGVICNYAINVGSSNIFSNSFLCIWITVDYRGCGWQSSTGQSRWQPTGLSDSTAMDNANMQSTTAAASVSQL
jgi:hypothetical protein